MTISRDQQHAEHATTELERREAAGDPVPDPGLPKPEPRLTDIQERAARRAERQVAGMFTLAALLVLVFLVAYVALPVGGTGPEGAADLDRVRTSNLVLGGTLGLALLLIGVGAIHWARKLMSSHEIVHPRHTLRSDDETRAAALEDFEVGTEESGFGRRKLIRNSLIGAMALLPLPAIVMLRDLGSRPEGVKKSTIWAAGVRVLRDRSFEPIRPSELDVGSLVLGMPATFLELPEEGPERLNSRAKSSVFLVRMLPGQFAVQEGRENWDVDGIVCYSRICTHVGCPVTLYERDTHHMMCPCHQSTFDLSDSGEVIFGPANRPLPQLPLAVDDEGYLVAQSDFVEPVGPSFWEMDA